jgi:plasmid stabilization system protein ParE
MKRRVIFGKKAEAELQECLSYLQGIRPGAEQALSADLADLLDNLSEFPELYRERGRRLRRAVLKRWSLGIFYRANARYVTE